MSKQFADVCWCHPHFAHPRGSGCSCSMRSNSSNDICLADSGELTEQRDRRIVQERFAHLLVPILEEIARRFVRFSVLQHLLVDRKSTRLNSSHQIISYAVFCLKKKNIDLSCVKISSYCH